MKKQAQKVILVCNKKDLKEFIPFEKVEQACRFQGIFKELSIRGFNISALKEEGIDQIYEAIK